MQITWGAAMQKLPGLPLSGPACSTVAWSCPELAQPPVDETSTALHICAWAKPPMFRVNCASIDGMRPLAGFESALSMQLPTIIPCLL